MKSLKIKQSLLIALILVISFSCSDLVEEPVGVLAPEGLFNTPSDVEAAVNGAYGLIASEQFYGRKLTIGIALRGDMVGMTREQGRRSAFDNFSLDPTNSIIDALFPRGFQIIAAANFALSGADKLEGSSAEVNALRGEARFIRAFAYYHMVRLFGSIPLINDPDLAGDPLFVSNLKPATVDEIYASIIEDLKFAKDNLPDTYLGGLLRSRASRGTAASYLASVYLTLASEGNPLGTYQLAMDEAKFVIDNASTFGYALQNDYADLYKATNYDNMTEHVFAVDFKFGFEEDGTNTDFIGSLFSPRFLTDGVEANGQLLITNGFDRLGPNIAVFNTWNDNDYRKSVSLLTSAFSQTIDPNTGTYAVVNFDGATSSWQPKDISGTPIGTPGTGVPYVKKYWGTEACGSCAGHSGQSDINFAAMRYAEVLLIAAEAATMGASGGSVDQFINPIRTRARNAGGIINTFPANVTSGFTREEVIEERKWELAFEFKRWYDIKRLKIGDQVFGPGGLDPQPAFNVGRDYLFPIPQADIDRNPDLGQNPGY